MGEQRVERAHGGHEDAERAHGGHEGAERARDESVGAKPTSAVERSGNGERRRRFRVWPVLLALLVGAALAAGGLFAWQALQPKGETGSYLIPQGDMTDEEAQAMLDEMAERSRITVSVRPRPELKDGKLHVNFVVEEPNNGLSERLEIEQDGAVVYRSGVVQPGYMVEWGDAPDARPGPATATVYAVGADGNDSGNPVSVEIEIVPGG